MTGGGFSRLERELLADAVEGTHLIEIRNDVGDTGLSVEDYRVQAGVALRRLVGDGLIDVSAGAWQGDATRPVDIEELQRRLADGSAWDPDAADLLIMDATDAGRQAMSVPPVEHPRQ